jgi:DNA-binding transcriptional LysR family regulator
VRHAFDIDAAALRCLVALVREGSVTRAAGQLGVSQPALSHMLARLRERFADPLLVRARTGVAPTPRALQLADAAQEVLDGMARLHCRRESFDPKAERGRFVLTVTDYFERLLTPPLLARLQVEAPGASIEWRTPDPVQARAALESGEIDLRLAWVHGPWAGLRFARLFSDRLVCLAREGHPGIGHRLTLAQFFSAAHVRPTIAVTPSPDGRVATEMTLEQYLGLPQPDRSRRPRAASTPGWQAHRNERLRVSVLAQSFLAIPSLVASSDLIATVPALILRSAGDVRGVRVLQPPLELPALHGALYWHERTNDDVRHKWFRRLVAAVAAGTAG